MTSVYASGTQTATISTEHTLSAPNAAGLFRLVVDLSNLVDGDVLEIRSYQMVLTAGTSRVMDVRYFYGAQATDELIIHSPDLPNELTDANATKFTLKQTAGTGRAFPWKVMNLDSSGGGGGATAAQIWDYLLTSITTVGSIGKLLKDDIDAAISSRLASASYASPLDAAGTRTAVGLAAANLDTQLSGITTKLPAALVAGRMDSSVGAVAAGLFTIKKNTALTNFEFLLVQSSDHITPKTGATVTAQRSIDGGAFAACANVVTEVGSGVYKIDLAATDLNGNVITLKFTATGADQRTLTILTQV